MSLINRLRVGFTRTRVAERVFPDASRVEFDFRKESRDKYRQDYAARGSSWRRRSKRGCADDRTQDYRESVPFERMNAEIKVFAPYKTVVEGKIVDGEVAELKVAFGERAKDAVSATMEPVFHFRRAARKTASSDRVCDGGTP